MLLRNLGRPTLSLVVRGFPLLDNMASVSAPG